MKGSKQNKSGTWTLKNSQPDWGENNTRKSGECGIRNAASNWGTPD